MTPPFRGINASTKAGAVQTPILMLTNDLQIRIIHATTGEIIRELTLNPAVDYQARRVRNPRPKPS
jgi:hypothetical protein